MSLTPIPHRFLTDAKNLRLTEQEKAEGRSALLARMTLEGATLISLSVDEKAMGRDALLASMRTRSEQVDAPHWLSSLFTFPLVRMPALALSALIIVLGGGAVAYAAESAIPGDSLYAVKVNVLEPLRERSIRTPEKHAAWQIKKIERRLGEARALVAAKRLTPEHRAMIERRISEQVVTLKDTLIPPPSVETHVAAQEVLVITLEKYEESAASDSALMASGDMEDISEEPEVKHLMNFVKERKAAARGEVDFAITTAIGAARSPAAVEASAGADITVKTKKPHAQESAESVSSDDRQKSGEKDKEKDEDQERDRNDLPAIQLRDDRHVFSAESASSQEHPVEIEVEENADEDADSSATTETSSPPEEEQELLQKVEEKKEIIEKQLRGL